jgi:hypothetical protein
LTLGHIVSHNRKISDEISIPAGKATSRVAFVFMLLEDGFWAGVKKNPTHLLLWPELK